ncbi:MAG: gamma-glutamylcyclotransferase family protein [Bacilli bacterium]
MLLFTYGTLLLPDVMQETVGFYNKPLKSVFVKGFKIKIIRKVIGKNPDYHLMFAIKTGNDNDIIPGFLVECSAIQLRRLDKFEGSAYKRESVEVFTRDMQCIDAVMYMKK